MKIEVFEKKQEEKDFSWRDVPAVDPDEVDRWMGATDARDRQFPLQVALQVHDELEHALMKPGVTDAMRLSEIRGGMMALSRFAKLYAAILESRRGVLSA